jgi:calcium-dependent protein kinase
MATARGNTDRKYAVKSLHLAGITCSSKKELLESEVEVFLHLDHPHVVRLYDVYEAETVLCLVMECMLGGELFDRVIERTRLTESDAAMAVWQMLLAINYLHSHGMVHRDLKLENFMYDRAGSDNLKLIDFGFSKVVHQNLNMSHCLGTMAYVAPEVLQGSYTSKCDLWSLGVITFILLAGYMPFKGSDEDQAKQIVKGDYHMLPDRWKHISEQGKKFTKGLLCVRPKDRLNAETALQHQWITQRRKGEGTQIEKPVADALRSFAKASKFRRCCLEMMAWSLTSEESAKVMEDFRKLDANNQGTITLTELKEVLVHKYKITDDEALKVFQIMDTNCDEEIHYSDFLAAMITTRINLHDDLLRRAFSKFDTDQSGYITPENLKEVLGDIAKGSKVADLLAEADYLKDGRISYEEFVRFLKEHKEEAQVGLVDDEIRKRRAKKLGLSLPRAMRWRRSNSFGTEDATPGTNRSSFGSFGTPRGKKEKKKITFHIDECEEAEPASKKPKTRSVVMAKAAAIKESRKGNGKVQPCCTVS